MVAGGFVFYSYTARMALPKFLHIGSVSLPLEDYRAHQVVSEDPPRIRLHLQNRKAHYVIAMEFRSETAMQRDLKKLSKQLTPY